MASVLGSHSQKGPITLTLGKFSHRTVATHHSSKIPWKHVYSQNNLFWVFDSMRRMDVSEQIVSKDVLKVVYQQNLLVRKKLTPEKTLEHSSLCFHEDRRMSSSMV